MSKKSIIWRKCIFSGLTLVLFALLCVPVSADGGSETVVGTIPYLLTATSDKNALYEECSLGIACADSIRIALNTDFAIVNGGDLTGNLPPGELSRDDFNSAIRPDMILAVAEISVSELRNILESALSHVVLTDDRAYDVQHSKNGAFPHISGFELAYDPAAPIGQRVVWIKYQGDKLDLADTERRFTLAATEYMLSGGYGLPAAPEAKAAEMTLRTAMEQYIRSGMGDYSTPARRITVIGLKITSYQKTTILLIIAIGCIFIALLYPFRFSFRRLLKKDK
ncbi:MAG: hypothetical protein GX189_06885 [Clostridiales bacterium]|nr:hypothetical protein [Clostridiales bacterium]